jgi:hypothetical protein
LVKNNGGSKTKDGGTWIWIRENKIWYARKRILYGIQTWGLHHTLAIEGTKGSINNFPDDEKRRKQVFNRNKAETNLATLLSRA